MRNFTTLCFILFILLAGAGARAQERDTIPADSSRSGPPLRIRTLKEVVVESRPPVRLKGDTLEYDASRFKTRENAVVEELLQKLPGVKVDKGGAITAQGETVQRVLVDGKEFFGNDPAIATKNLPADMVDRIQVLDKMSDQEEFTGIDDGNKVKTINIITKKDRKQGYFGNVSAGGGPDGKYEGGLNINSFAGDQQLSLLLKANNVNKSGFSASELLRMAAGNPELFNNLPAFAISELSKMKGVRINSDDPAEKAELARPAGRNNTQYGGVNYNNDWGRRLQWRSSYFYNRFTSSNDYTYNRHYLLPDTAYQFLQDGTACQSGNDHRLNASADIRLNERHSLKISPQAVFNTAEQSGSRRYSSSGADGQQLLNQGSQDLHTSSHTTQAGADILYRRRFAKTGRTLSVQVTPASFNMSSVSFNTSRNQYYNTGAGEVRDSIRQQTNARSESYSLDNSIVYTEQLFPHLALKLHEQLCYSQGRYRQQALNFNPAGGAYNLEDARYSDLYGSNTFKTLTDIALAGSYRRFNFTAGAGWQHSRLDGSSDYKGYQVRGRYGAFLPHAYARYRFTRSKRLTLHYKSRAVLPGLSQLRPLEDITDPLYVRKGNPDLQQAVDHTVTLAYLSTNVYRNTFTNIQLRLSTVKDQFTDLYTTDSSGRQLITPINASDNFSGSLHAERSVPLGDNGSNLTMGAALAYDQYPAYFNAVADKIQQWSLTPDLQLSYYPLHALSITARGNAAWNHRHNAAGNSLTQQYWFLDYGLELAAILPGQWTADAGLACYTTTGLSEAYNNTIALLNAGITRDIGKRYMLRLEGQDLLNRNRSFTRLARNGYTEDRRNQVLGRYFLLSLIYKLRHFTKG
ncbi:outer membrane beta-barrel protein [Chitinophaga japonensis]|uniref:Outer membrane receptor protein involved in Fe transport n=1 Tax=Chitinophaga japonensis TaxID=104662 RepID=A0A562SYS1_CHIJA|nr:outer membrane beta-barrel protein [Chitinophaga japonensis]TWI86475.1 outer membrane receptor protein involved in Fe transport [Chitinophaga japonensis]